MSRLYVMDNKRGIKSFLKGRGFYIIVVLCVAAIGVLGYYTLKDAVSPDDSLIIDGEDNKGGDTNGGVVDNKNDTSRFEASQGGTSSKPDDTSSAPGEEDTDTVNNPGDTKTVVFSSPLAGEVLKEFAKDTLVKSATMGDFRVHPAVDIAAPLNTEVKAAANGTVEDVYMGNDGDMLGMTVVIKHKDGTRTVYANLAESVPVKKGDSVKKGDVIGKVGKTAQSELSDPPHLHFEVIRDGGQVNPESLMKIAPDETSSAR